MLECIDCTINNFDYLNCIDNNDINLNNFVLTNFELMRSNKVPERTPFSYDLHINKKSTYQGYMCSFINLPNHNTQEYLYQQGVNINNTQSTNQNNNPNNKYNDNYINKIRDRCESIVRKHFQSENFNGGSIGNPKTNIHIVNNPKVDYKPRNGEPQKTKIKDNKDNSCKTKDSGGL